jgi:hypothetical protein
MAAVVAVASGIYVMDDRIPYVGPFSIGWVAPPVTVLWLLFATNAMNFIDGLDGLAGGVALIAAGFLAAIAAAYGGWFAYFAALLLTAGLAGFLPFNFPRARIFMGDVGSQFSGFILAVLAVVASRLDNVELSFLIVPMLLSGVLFDVAFTLIRRAFAGERLTEPHRGHLYQMAQRAGLPPVSITLVHWGFAGFGGLCAVLFLAAPTPAKPFIPLLALPPQLCWLGFVVHRARQAGIARWDDPDPRLVRGPGDRPVHRLRVEVFAHGGSRRLLCRGSRIASATDRAQVVQEGGALQRPAALGCCGDPAVHLASRQVDSRSAGRARAGSLASKREVGRQPRTCMSAVAQVAGQEDAVYGRRDRAIAPNQGDASTENAEFSSDRRRTAAMVVPFRFPDR